MYKKIRKILLILQHERFGLFRHVFSSFEVNLIIKNGYSTLFETRITLVDKFGDM